MLITEIAYLDTRWGATTPLTLPSLLLMSQGASERSATVSG